MRPEFRCAVSGDAEKTVKIPGRKARLPYIIGGRALLGWRYGLYTAQASPLHQSTDLNKHS
jgi:hypothetical protein